MRLSPLLVAFLFLFSCFGTPGRSDHSFDEIVEALTGKNAAEVEEMLGEPDRREPVFLVDEKWIWWDYTFLDGKQYPPEERQTPVHLEIIFRKPPVSRQDPIPKSEWTIDESFGISYRLPKRPER